MNASVLYAQKVVGKSNETSLLAESEDVLVTAELAASWLAEHTYERQRPVRARHVEYLAEEMRRNFFRQGTQIHFVRFENQLHLVNGQHTLSAIVKSGLPQVISVCYTSEDPAEAYSRHDVHLKRTTADMFSALQMGDELGFSATQINRLGAAAKFIDEGFNRSRAKRFHPDDQVRVTREYAPAAELYFEATAGKSHTIKSAMERVATFSVGLAIYRYAYPSGEKKVDDFWTGVALGVGLEMNDPRGACREHLLNTGIAGGRDKADRLYRTVNYSSRYVANCWNAWVENRSIRNTRVLDVTAPIIIKGTPFDGSITPA